MNKTMSVPLVERVRRALNSETETVLFDMLLEQLPFRDVFVCLPANFHSRLALDLTDDSEGREILGILSEQHPGLYHDRAEVWKFIDRYEYGHPVLTKKVIAELGYDSDLPPPKDQKIAVVHCIWHGDIETLRYLVGELGFAWDRSWVEWEDSRGVDVCVPSGPHDRFAQQYDQAASRACVEYLLEGGPKNANS